MSGNGVRPKQWLDRFLFESVSPIACVRLRISYAVLLVVYIIVWGMDASLWFSDEGVLQADTAHQLSFGPGWSLFRWLPSTPIVIHLSLAIMLLQAIALLVGWHSRLQIACLFIWLVSFQSRNPLISDGEDALFRLFAFFMIWMPLDHAFSISGRSKRSSSDRKGAAWAIRLPQVQMTLLYGSAVWSKLLGGTWRDGSAMFYVYQMDDLYGRGPMPEWITTSPLAIEWTTYAVLLIEAGLPIALWIPRTRRLAVVAGIGLHLSMEYALNLFLFQWIMIVGLLTFWPERPETPRQSEND